MTGNRDRTKAHVVYGTCAFEGCGRRFRQHGGAGRPRAYCQAACRRRAQRVRDRARQGKRVPVPVRGLALEGAPDPSRRSGRPGTAAPSRPSPDGLGVLGSTLASLLWLSGLTLDQVVQRSYLEPSCVRRALAGESLLDWPTVYVLVGELGGRPQDVRWMWEWASGWQAGPSRSVTISLTRLHGALRGLRLAAAGPSPAAGLTGDLWSESADGALLPDLLPDWDSVRAAVEDLGGDSGCFWPLWEDARQAVLIAQQFLSSPGAPDAVREM